MSAESPRLSIREKLAYGLGDSAANLVGATQATFLLFFYTDVLGISALAAGTDPAGLAAGRCVQRSDHGRAGRSDTYALGPLSTMGPVDCRAVGGRTGALLHDAKLERRRESGLGDRDLQPADDRLCGKQHSVLRAIGRDDRRRRRANQSGLLAVSVCDGELRWSSIRSRSTWSTSSGAATSAFGYQATMMVWGVVIVICFATTFALTKERIKPSARQQSSMRQDLADLFHNGPWIALFVLALLIYIQLGLRSGTMLYYFQHYQQAPRLVRLDRTTSGSSISSVWRWS